jgi:bifunctional non-homologous end joining protein LigD
MDAKRVKLSHPEKILFPQAHITKKKLAAYYQRIAPTLLGYIADRPLTFKQFPDGIDKPGYFRKHVPEYFPAYVKRTMVPRRDPTLPPVAMATADEAADLKYFANQNVIELHMTTATLEDLDVPDQLVFDLDPADNDFSKARALALLLKEALDEREVPCFVKLSGLSGLHLHVPIQPNYHFAQLKTWTRDFAQEAVSNWPQLATLEHLKTKRGNKVYIDILRNDYAQTVVAPYSVRGFRGAPVAIPLQWGELTRGTVHPGYIHLGNVQRRLGQMADPWACIREHSINAEVLVNGDR